MGQVRRLHGERPPLKKKTSKRRSCPHCGYVFHEYNLISKIFSIFKVCPSCFRKIDGYESSIFEKRGVTCQNCGAFITKPKIVRKGINRKKYCPHCETRLNVPGITCPNCNEIVYEAKIIRQGFRKSEICPHCEFAFTPFLGVPSKLGVSLPSVGDFDTNPFTTRNQNLVNSGETPDEEEVHS